MNPGFLPIELHGVGNRRCSVDYQYGSSGTEIHWHDCIEIIYMEKGCIVVFFGNQWNLLKAGDMILLPPGRIHCTKCDDPAAEKIVVGIDERMIVDEQDEDRGLLLPLLSSEIEQYCIFRNLKAGGADWYLRNLSKIDWTSPVAGLRSSVEIMQLYAWLYERWMEWGFVGPEPVRGGMILKIQNRLRKDFANAPTAKEMAAALNVSYSYMCRVLRENLRMNYCDLLNHARVEGARKLLLTTEKSITEIGLDCGFCDAAYFIKIFKRFTGETPRRYRTFRNGETG